MKKLHRKQWLWTAAAVTVFASASLAQTTAGVTLTGVGDGATLYSSSSNYNFGVYVDPYTATVGTATNVPVICDDWSNNSYVPETWTANVYTLASINAGQASPLFGDTTANEIQTYDEAAWLATQLLANPTNQNLQAEVSFAIWELTYGADGTAEESPSPTAFLSNVYGGSALAGTTVAAIQSQVASLLSQAATAVNNGYNGAGWEVLTPNTADSISSPGSASNPPQEFLVYTPESSSGILFAADIFGLLGLAIVFRRRLLRSSL